MCRACACNSPCCGVLVKVRLFFSFPPPVYFTELHGRSERSLQEVLSPLGPLYSQNSRLYADLYTDLRQYYRGSALNLDENLSEFWSRLLERTFKASAPTDVSKDKVSFFSETQNKKGV